MISSVTCANLWVKSLVQAYHQTGGPRAVFSLDVHHNHGTTVNADCGPMGAVHVMQQVVKKNHVL